MNNSIDTQKIRDGFWIAVPNRDRRKARAGNTEAEAIANVKAAHPKMFRQNTPTEKLAMEAGE